MESLVRSKWQNSTSVTGEATSEVAMPAINHLTGTTYAERWGVPRNDTGSTDRTAALQAAIDNTVGKLVLPPGIFRVSSDYLDIIERHGICIEGQGAYDSGEGTCFKIDKADCTLFDCKSTYEMQLKNFMVKGNSVPTSGATIKLGRGTPAYGVSSSLIENVRIEDCYDGIVSTTCNNINIDNLQLRKPYGTAGVKFAGTSSTYRADVMNITRMVADIGTDSTLYAYSDQGNWTATTAYSAGDIVLAPNGNMYICSTGGTSSGTAPTGKGTIGNRSVTDGTVTWQFMTTSSYAHVLHDNYAYTLHMDHARLLNAAYGIRMSDTAATGSSYPTWLRGNDVDCDHSIISGLLAERGEDVMFYDLWISSTQIASGINVGANHRGGLRLINSEVNFSGQHGILLDSGPTGNVIQACQIGHNGRITTNTYDGIALGSTASRFQIIGNRLDARPTSTSNDQRYGVGNNAATNDRYVILGNCGEGSGTGLIADSTNNSTRYVAGNIA